jgi:hypothetical protein
MGAVVTTANRKRPRFVGAWLSESGFEAVDVRAKTEGVSRSDMLRRMLAYAAWKMPKGWRP